MTYEELKSKLKFFGEVTILEVLNISADELLNRFEDKLEEKFTELSNEFLDGEADDDETE